MGRSLSLLGLCCVGFAFLTVLARVRPGNAQIATPTWIGKNCTSRYNCGSDSALCINDTCRYCSGLGPATCRDTIDVMQRCLPYDTSLDTSICAQRNTTVPCVCRHKPLLYQRDLETFDIIGGVVMFVASSIAAGGGIGGGGIFVPILVLLFRFTAQAAVPLSNVTILGASIANFIQMAPKKLPGDKYGRPLINYSMALALQPAQMAGTVVGVVLNAIFPDWLILILIVVTLSISIWRSSLKGVELCKKERKEKRDFELMANSPEQSPTKPLEPDDKSSSSPIPSHLIESRFPIVKVLLIFFFLAVVTAHNIIIGTPTRPSYVGIKLCSPIYFGILVAVFPVLFIGIVITTWYLLREARQKAEAGFVLAKNEFRWTKVRALVLNLVALLAGLMSSLLGLGGGTVISPLLLELNVAPQSVSATATFMILFTSGASVIQFAIAGRIPWDYGVTFLILGIFTSAFGQTVLTIIINKSGRRSIVVWVIVFIIFASMILLAVVGGLDLATRLQNGGSIGFKNFCPSS